MSFTEAIQDGFAHYTNFQGRASRAAYWWWFLFAIIVAVVANIVDSAIEAPIFTTITGLGLLLPGLSVAIRRLHDTNRSGWWILIGLIPLIGFIVLLVFYIQQGDAGPNEYGPEPPDRAGGAGAAAAPPPAA